MLHARDPVLSLPRCLLPLSHTLEYLHGLYSILRRALGLLSPSGPSTALPLSPSLDLELTALFIRELAPNRQDRST